MIFSAFPEFRFMDEMMANLNKKLNPGGNVSTADQVCYTKGHVNYNAKGVSKMKSYRFYMSKHGRNKQAWKREHVSDCVFFPLILIFFR